MGKFFKAMTKETGAKNSQEIESSKKNSQKEMNTPVPLFGKKIDSHGCNQKTFTNWDERLQKSVLLSGQAVENFRTLRTRILYPAEGKPPRSLLVTSAAPGEGKSFVCANLGILLAQGIKEHSLVVDCDLRNPSMHNLFGLKNDTGLVDYLANRYELPEVIVKTGADKLSLLPAGPIPENPAELLGSARMLHLARELVGRYEDRIVILDSPPLQAAAETAILAKHVDGVVVVVRWGGSRREHVRELVELVGREKIIGVVFNSRKVSKIESFLFGNNKDKYYYYGYN